MPSLLEAADAFGLTVRGSQAKTLPGESPGCKFKICATELSRVLNLSRRDAGIRADGFSVVRAANRETRITVVRVDAGFDGERNHTLFRKKVPGTKRYFSQVREEKRGGSWSSRRDTRGISRAFTEGAHW
jgi:hypothetical protein